MAENNVMDQLAALNAAIQTIPVSTENGDAMVQDLEAVKRGLDDARLGLWALKRSGGTTKPSPARPLPSRRRTPKT